MKGCSWRLVTSWKSYSINSDMWTMVRNLFKFANLIKLFMFLLFYHLIDLAFCRCKNNWNFHKWPHTKKSNIQAFICFNSYRWLFTMSLVTPYPFMLCTTITYKYYHVLFYFMFSTYFQKWTNRLISLFTWISN